MATYSNKEEKREFGRRITSLGGWVKVKGRPALACRVVDLSEGGALLRFHAPTPLPRRFTLKIDTGSIEHLCETRHDDGLSVGVQFILPTAATNTVDPKAVRDLEAFARMVPWGQDAY